MKRTFFFTLALLVAICTQGQVRAEMPIQLTSFAGDSDCACDDLDGCDDCDVCEHAWLVEAEATIFRYHRADGLRVGDDPGAGDNIDPGRFNAAPRVTVGYITPGGAGVRGRWWSFDQNYDAVEGAPSRLDVDTYNIDVELFDQFQLNEVWDLDLSAGLRYNSFDEQMFDLVGDAESRSVSFDGWGAVLGAEAKRYIRRGAIYGRARSSLLMDNQRRINVASGNQLILDVPVSQTELALGYELTRTLAGGSILYLRTGGEYQLWSNYSSNFNTAAGDPEQVWVGSSDVGFVGFTSAIGILY